MDEEPEEDDYTPEIKVVKYVDASDVFCDCDEMWHQFLNSDYYCGLPNLELNLIRKDNIISWFEYKLLRNNSTGLIGSQVTKLLNRLKQLEDDILLNNA